MFRKKAPLREGGCGHHVGKWWNLLLISSRLWGVWRYESPWLSASGQALVGACWMDWSTHENKKFIIVIFKKDGSLIWPGKMNTSPILTTERCDTELQAKAAFWAITLFRCCLTILCKARTANVKRSSTPRFITFFLDPSFASWKLEQRWYFSSPVSRKSMVSSTWLFRNLLCLLLTRLVYGWCLPGEGFWRLLKIYMCIRIHNQRKPYMKGLNSFWCQRVI